MPVVPASLRLILTVLLSFALGSCGTVEYYSQAAHGQYEILHGAKPIEEVEAEPSTPKELRQQLELIRHLREFARDHLDLTAQKQFGTYRDLQRPYVLWNVYAAPEFSTEAKSWWYPLIGSAKYRGYFSIDQAKASEKHLKGEGNDVFVAGIRVYSTLGWFHDPVLNTFVDADEANLAETLFHELAHARVFVSGDTDFNEAFATAVGEEGVRRWFRSQGRLKDLREYERSLVQERRVLHLLQAARSQLDNLYAGKDNMPVEELRRRKEAVFEKLRADYRAMKRHGLAGDKHDYWFDARLNNARLATVDSYHGLVPAFARLLQKDGSDFSKFYADVAAMKSLTKDQRRERLNEGAPQQ